MKRIASFVLTLLLILSLCACSLPQAKPAEEPTDELELVEEAAEAAEAEAPEERSIKPEETAPEASQVMLSPVRPSKVMLVNWVFSASQMSEVSMSPLMPPATAA